jgi:acyl-homoserine lactone acylase PvdQ
VAAAAGGGGSSTSLPHLLLPPGCIISHEAVLQVSMQQMPMFTYIYADHNGDTFYQSNSWTPDYSGLPFDYDWASANGPPVPTVTSALRWTNIVPWISQPQLTSPMAGGMSNANDPPWYATLPAHAPDPDEYAEYHLSDTSIMNRTLVG